MIHKLRLAKRSLPSVLTVAGIVLGLAGWGLQSSAASDLQAALQVRGKEVPDEGGSPPSLEQYRAVVSTIERSIGIRRDIDAVLGDIEEQITALVNSQADSRAVVDGALESLLLIGKRLDSSVDSARKGAGELASLRQRLRRTYVLARRIANELEELDESMGPSAGGGP